MKPSLIRPPSHFGDVTSAGDAFTRSIADLLSAVLTDQTRLYRLEGDAPAIGELLVEAWAERSVLNEPWALELVALSRNPDLDLDALIGQRVTLVIALADGSLHRRTGLILGVESEEADGGLARYRLRIGPWLALLAQAVHSQAWQEQPLTTILDAVFGAYAPEAKWRYADCVAPHLAQSPFLASEAGQSAQSGQNGQSVIRPYVAQYRQTDLAFVQRLLREEGLVARFERDTDTLVILADTATVTSTPLDASAAASSGQIRFHRADGTETTDTVQQLGSQRLLVTYSLAASASHPEQHRVIATEIPAQDLAGNYGEQATAQNWQGYDYLGEAQGGLLGLGNASLERLLTLAQTGLEAHRKTFLGRSSVRSFTPGTRFELVGSPLDAQLSLKGNDASSRTLVLTGVLSVGINNLPKGLSPELAQLQDRAQAASEGSAETTSGRSTSSRRQRHAPPILPAWVPLPLRQQAAQGGYANSFAATRAHLPWRSPWRGLGSQGYRLHDGRDWLGQPDPALSDARTIAQSLQADEWQLLLPATALPLGEPLYPKAGAGPFGDPAQAPGLLTATVVGPGGSTEHADTSAHMDALGRIRVRFDHQDLPGSGDNTRMSTWVRVAQTWAGDQHGAQFIPRIGQQVLCDFIDGDLEQPLVVGSLYDGRGEGGIAATPGGADGQTDRTAFGQSSDHHSAAQANLSGGLIGGHSPAWHGASPEDLSQDGQRNPASLSGFKSQAWQGEGFNQLVLDDSDTQLRIQLASTQHASQLNLGHLIHQADNHRGSFRGLGFELRTDAYAAIRAAQGLLISTASTQAQEPAHDNAPGIALGKQLTQLASSFSQGAQTHLTPTLAAHQGATQAKHSSQSGQEAPLPAMLTALKGLADASTWEGALQDASQRTTTGPLTGKTPKVPSQAAPSVHLQGQASITEVAGQDLIQTANQTITEAAGQDFHQAIGQDWRVHSGQAIAVTAGLIKAGSGGTGTGISLIAGQQDVSLQAQSDAMTIAAKGAITIGSQSAHIEWAAATKITLSTAGGASITIESGKITLQCPGTITVKAGMKKLEGPVKAPYTMPVLPKADNSWVEVEALYDDTWATRWPQDRTRLDLNGDTVTTGATVHPT